MDQIAIKVALILAFLAFGFFLLRSGSSARTQAFRTLGIAAFLAAAIVAVVFPSLVNELAKFVGVGRGTDLVLYAFIVVFIGNALSTARKRRQQDAQITELARRFALAEPTFPERRPEVPDQE